MARRSPTIRTRLTAWFAGSIALVLVAYAVASFVAVRRDLYAQIDELLEDDLYAARSAVAADGSGGVIWQPAVSVEEVSDDRAAEAWLPNGQPLHRSAVMSAFPALPTDAVADSADVTGTGGSHWRTLTSTFRVGQAPVVVRVARSTERVRDDVAEVAFVLFGGLPLMVLLASLGGYALAGRVLQPIDQLARDAERITADRLHERLSSPNARDEIGRLTAVINGAFGRIAASVDQLRRFTADASHELRTPLAIVRTIGEGVLAEPRTTIEYRDAIGSMLEEVDRMTALVSALLRLTSADAGTATVRRAEIDLAALARDIAASVGVLAEELDQEIVVSGAPVRVLADAMLLQEALTNILHNAVKYSPAGSTITVAVSAQDGWAVVAVADQGPGIDRAHRDRIFDRFFRIDDSRARRDGGTGLGLAIAKWAVEANDGTIEVDDAAGGGALFRVRVPQVASPRAELPSHDTTAASRAS